jgi:hypothetical protein
MGVCIMNKILIGFLIIGLLIGTTACSNSQTGNVVANTDKTVNDKTDIVKISNIQNIADIKKEEFLGKTVSVKGMVVNNLKTSRLSGYRLKDATDSIPVSSQNLPVVNTTVSVTGVLQTSSYFGYYIAVTP